MGGLLHILERQVVPESAEVEFRVPERIRDLLWILLAVFVLPNLLVLGLFGRSAEFFRGWINVEIGLAFALCLALRSPRWGLGLIALELVSDLVEPVAHVFYFSSGDAMEALRYVQVQPPMRVVGYVVALLVYLCVLSSGFLFLARRVRGRSFAAGIVLALLIATSAAELFTGRYASLFHADTRSSRTLLIRTPVASLITRSLARRHGPKAQQIDSSYKHLSPGAEALIAQKRVNVVSVLVESWGLFRNAELRSAIAGPLTSPEIAAQYQIQMGSVPFVGSTLFGESRSLCGEIFERPLQNVMPQRLAQCYPAQLERMGYSTVAIHGLYGHMYGRDEWMPKAGIERGIFGPELKGMGMQTCLGGLPGICDSDVADLVHRQLLEKRDGRPQFIHWTTLDSHLPIQLTAESEGAKNCASAPGLDSDDALCVWYSLIRRLNAKLAEIALDTRVPPTVFMVVGDHAPPFYSTSRRARFSQSEVPLVILVPKNVKPS